MTSITSAVTFGQIVTALNERDHRVRYALSKIGQRPIRRCGNALVWPAEIIVAIRTELDGIDARRSKATTVPDEC